MLIFGLNIAIWIPDSNLKRGFLALKNGVEHGHFRNYSRNAANIKRPFLALVSEL